MIFAPFQFLFILHCNFFIIIFFLDLDATDPTMVTLFPDASNFSFSCVYGGFVLDPETITWYDSFGPLQNISDYVSITTVAQITMVIVTPGAIPDFNFMNRRYTCVQSDEYGILNQDFNVNCKKTKNGSLHDNVINL